MGIKAAEPLTGKPFFLSSIKAFILICSLFLSGTVTATDIEKKFTLSGHLVDKTNGESLVGANVYVKEISRGTVTNLYGYYSITLNQGTYNLVISYVGFKTEEKTIELNQDVTLSLELEPTAIETEEVVITGRKLDRNVTSTEISRVELSADKIKALPVVFGETDILRTITLLPGIKSGGEGSTGFYVRGGGPDQNLILLDEAVIYNASHLLGFFSVFNADAVKNVEVIKGGMPANYGGRLSSIVNVTMREGNNKEFNASGGVGLISSRLALEGPIKKNKSSFFISGRRTYIDQLVQPFLNEEQKGNGYFFYDLNAKANYTFSEKDRIYFSSYIGRDVFTFKSPEVEDVKFGVSWGNSMASLRWNHVFNKKLFLNTTAIYNTYGLRTTANFGPAEFALRTSLEDWSFKTDFQYFPSVDHKVKFGASYIRHKFTPGIINATQGGVDINAEINNQFANEWALYIQDEFEFSPRLAINAGLRYSLFSQVGPYDQVVFNELGQRTDSVVTFRRGESIAMYDGLEPRLSARYNLTSTSSLKASVTKTFQYLHLATSSAATLPTDLWVPSSRLVKPQTSWQYTLGYFRNFEENTYETSVEAYYKPMFNQIEFRPGAQLFFNQNLENEMIFGEGLSYGLEVLIKKNKGKTTGWIGYTWSKTTRQFDELNNGDPYLYRYDRRHDVSLVMSHKLSAKWQFNFVFVYGTGNRLTLPTGRFAYSLGIDQSQGIPVFNVIDEYTDINTFTMPAYHRADISFNYVAKKTEKFESSWNFSVYNIYNRGNPYFIYFTADAEEGRAKAFKVFLFPILPSVSWNFKF